MPTCQGLSALVPAPQPQVGIAWNRHAVHPRPRRMCSLLAGDARARIIRTASSPGRRSAANVDPAQCGLCVDVSPGSRWSPPRGLVPAQFPDQAVDVLEVLHPEAGNIGPAALSNRGLRAELTPSVTTRCAATAVTNRRCAHMVPLPAKRHIFTAVRLRSRKRTGPDKLARGHLIGRTRAE